MNRIVLFFLPAMALFFLSFDKKSLLNKPMPLLPNKTLDGKVIDEHYYNGHVTVVSFMFIGCMPCMDEISTLNKINDDYSVDKRVQVLCVARQMKQQMVQFNSNEKSIYNRIRKALDADPIRYSIQPACSDTVSKMIVDSAAGNTSIKSECTTIEDTYGFDAFPTLFYVDKKGIIRDIHRGGPGRKNDTAFYNEIKKEVDVLLAE